MKYILHILLFFLILSCSENSDNGMGPGPNNNPTAGTFQFDLDGDTWKATDNFVFASIIKTESAISLSLTASKSISSTEAEAIAISIYIVGNSESDLENTFSFGETSTASLAFSTTHGQNIISYIAISGMIKIKEVSATNIIGTFSAVCVNGEDQSDTSTMENGTFNAIRGM